MIIQKITNTYPEDFIYERKRGNIMKTPKKKPIKLKFDLDELDLIERALIVYILKHPEHQKALNLYQRIINYIDYGRI